MKTLKIAQWFLAVSVVVSLLIFTSQGIGGAEALSIEVIEGEKSKSETPSEQWVKEYEKELFKRWFIEMYGLNLWPKDPEIEEMEARIEKMVFGNPLNMWLPAPKPLTYETYKKYWVDYHMERGNKEAAEFLLTDGAPFNYVPSITPHYVFETVPLARRVDSSATTLTTLSFCETLPYLEQEASKPGFPPRVLSTQMPISQVGSPKIQRPTGLEIVSIVGNNGDRINFVPPADPVNGTLLSVNSPVSRQVINAAKMGGGTATIPLLSTQVPISQVGSPKIQPAPGAQYGLGGQGYNQDLMGRTTR